MCTKTFRFNVSSELNDKMIEFSALHKFEDRKTLKENYENWLETQEIRELIEAEESILRRSSYDLSKTSIQSKIFKSIKYYHIKNMIKEMQPMQHYSIETTEKGCKGCKCRNIVFSPSMVEVVKLYLEENISNPEFKPSSCFADFKTEYSEAICSEYAHLHEKYNDDMEINDEMLDLKLKKMFKNQYFTLFKASKCHK